MNLLCDLDEACEIAERGPTPLFLADIHLHRARLFGSLKSEASRENYPWEPRHKDLAEARRPIENHGYLRRKEELDDAEAAARDWPATPKQVHSPCRPVYDLRRANDHQSQ